MGILLKNCKRSGVYYWGGRGRNCLLVKMEEKGRRRMGILLKNCKR